MDYDQMIRDTETRVMDAQINNDMISAHYHQLELTRLMNERRDNMNMMMNPPMFIRSSAKLNPNDFLVGPGNFIMTDDPNSSNVSWQTESDDSFKKRQELDQRRNLKLFIHFAKELCERYPNWTLTPDANDPFKNVTLQHNNGKYKIQSAYPDNAVKLWGIYTNQAREDAAFHRRKGIPQGIFRSQPETTPTYTFFGWALGMDDTPEWIKE